ncbi:MAG: ion transporter [Kiritimatiellae bacterium]|jgi:voltage-gated potassium channel|nr:ion transporter [Kiritimatiellia bacterium]
MKLTKEKILYYLDSNESATGRIIDLLLTLVNLFACGLIVIQSLHGSGERWPMWLKAAEAGVVIIFSGEYILRLATAKSKLRYIFSFYGFVDLVSILPSIIIIEGFNFLRALKVLRILRFIRMLKSTDFFFGRISRFQLQAVKTLFTVFTILFVFSGFIYFAESASDQPEIMIRNFPEASYFVVTTLSTVGFGDYVAVTALGKFFTAVMILSGAILIPWQAGKLVRMLILNEGSKKDVTCPSCGLTGHDLDASHCKACGHVIFQKYEGDL